MTSQNPILLSDLVGKKVEDETGKFLGRVQEVRVKNSVIEVLICGPLGFLQRFASFRTGKRVRWDQVMRFGKKITVYRSKNP